jgi:hypothetical protein
MLILDYSNLVVKIKFSIELEAKNYKHPFVGSSTKAKHY